MTVLIPLFNGVDVLHEALKSVKNQAYTNWTCVVGVNGHGPDGGDCFQKARRAVEDLNDPRFSVINLPEVKGAPEAINAMVANASTEWIAHLDADDMWHPLKLLFQVYVATTYPQLGVIGTFARYFGEFHGQPEQPPLVIPESVFHVKNPMIHSSILIKKQYANYTNEFYGIYDYDCWVRLVKQGVLFYNLPYPLTLHRICDSISVFNSSKKQKPEDVRQKYFGHA